MLVCTPELKDTKSFVERVDLSMRPLRTRTMGAVGAIKFLSNLLHAVAARGEGLFDGPIALWHGCEPGQRRRRGALNIVGDLFDCKT